MYICVLYGTDKSFVVNIFYNILKCLYLITSILCFIKIIKILNKKEHK